MITKKWGAPRGVFPGEFLVGGAKPGKFIATGEFRPPQQGEFYLSGAITTAYKSRYNLTESFWIAVPAKPEPVTVKVCSLCRRDWTAGHDCTEA